jgi:hypothetical protein
MDKQFLSCHRALIMNLMREHKNVPKKIQKSCSFPISCFFPHLPAGLKREVIKTVLSSSSIPVRRAMYRVLNNHWTDKLRQPVDEAWNRLHDVDCVPVIINHYPPEELLSRFDILFQLAGDWYRRKLTVRSGSLDYTKLDQLKQVDEVGYVYALAKLGHTISTEIGWDILVRSLESPDVGLLIWSFGVMRQTELVDKIIIKSNECGA